MSPNSIYATAMMLLYTLKDDPQYAALSKLSYALDRKNLESLLDVFGGTTLTIPTKQEFNEAIKGIAYYQARYVKKYTPQSAQTVSGANQDTISCIDKKAKYIDKILSEIEL